MIRICGVTVCVDYADLLLRSLDLWKRGLDQLIVVTTPRDQDTQRLCDSYGVATHVTEVFTAGGATFNKAGAICEAIESKQLLRDADWLLIFDADIVPSTDWRAHVEMQEPQPGLLYGAPRHHEDGRTIADSDIAGYFMMFHQSDPRAQSRPLFTNWAHCGNFDTEFTSRWPPDRKKLLQLPLTHLGETSQNWWGRGNVGMMRQMFRERARRGGSYEHERI